METFLEILKYSIPALIVFATIYTIMKKYMDNQYALESLKFRQGQNQDILPLKLQAYERLMLLCERISIPNLTYRLANKDITKEQLQTAMMIAIQQEYEHNLTQQIYVSDKLWDIINLAKDQTIQLIGKASEGMQAGDPPSMLVERATRLIDSMSMNPLEQAKSAIKQEIKQLL